MLFSSLYYMHLANVIVDYIIQHSKRFIKRAKTIHRPVHLTLSHPRVTNFKTEKIEHFLLYK